MSSATVSTVQPVDLERFSIREARAIVQHLFVANPARYWSDYLLTMSVAWLTFGLAPLVGLPWGLVLFVVSVLAWYRGAIFTHELTHRPKNELRAFRVIWNLTCGIPLLIPSFLYETHLDHHNGRNYGRPQDGEYIPFARRPPRLMLGFLVGSVVAPCAGPVRFAILTPLGWLNPRLQRRVYARASALEIDFTYERQPPTAAELPSWRLQEIACLGYILLVLGLVIANVVSLDRLALAYATLAGVVFVNSVRLLAAHRYRSNEAEMTFKEQVLDSINYPNDELLNSVWAPVGLRFHALHHLFPTIPYHSLGEAHACLMERLPPDSPYRLASSPSLGASVRGLWLEAAASQKHEEQRPARV